MYRVIKDFTDRFDNNYLYHVGNIYPREDFEPTEERIQSLLTADNLCGEPFIKEEISADFMNPPQEPTDSTIPYTRRGILKMNKAELVPIADNIGIEEAEYKSVNDLKEQICNYYGL